MALDNLQDVIENLRDMIETHRGYLSGRETRTRQVLIDPLLRELGWDVSDPAAVQLEYKVGQQWADYALIFNDRPVAVIEAKRLESNLEDDEMIQVLNYANRDGIDYMIVTDGDKWEMYEVFRRGALEERLLMKFQVSQQSAHKAALQTLAMWRPNLVSDGGPFEATEPVFISDGPPEQQTPSDPPLGEEESDEGNGSPPGGRKNRPTRLIVTMPDGEKIDHDSAIKTLAEVIQKLGINQVRSVYPSLMSISKSSKHGYPIGQYYMRHQTNTEAKKRILEKVAGELGVQLQVEIVSKN